MTEAIIVAAIGAVGVVLASMLQGFRKENRADHAVVSTALNRIETKLDGHINDHAKGVYAPEPAARKDVERGPKTRQKRPVVGESLPAKVRRSRG